MLNTEIVSVAMTVIIAILIMVRQMAKTSTNLQKQLNDAYAARQSSENDISALKAKQSQLETDVYMLKTQRQVDSATIKNLSENCRKINSREIRLWRIISGILSLSIIWYQSDPRR